MKRTLIIASVVAVAVVAVWFISLRPTQTGSSGIIGNVLLGPTCPVVRNLPDPQCADKPYKTSLVVTTVDGAHVLATVTSDTDGTFRVAIPPGEYAVRAAASANILPRCNEQLVVVPVDAYATATIQCDTGIR
jgi:hypothetical protein